MNSTLLRCSALMSCAALGFATGACSSTTNPGGSDGATGGNATGGAAQGGQGGPGGSSVAQGGSGGSTGASGAAGTTGSGPADAGHGTTYFFAFKTVADVGAAAVSNTADADKNDLGVHATADGGSPAMTSFDMTVGDPDPGSLKIQLPSSAFGQFLDYQFILPVITDMGDKIASVMLRVDSGFSPADSPGSIYLYAKSGDNWDWAQGVGQTIAPASYGQWVEYTMPMTTLGAGSTAAFDPGYVKAIGIHISTGGGGAGVTDLPTPAVLHLDSLGYHQ